MTAAAAWKAMVLGGKWAAKYWREMGAALAVVFFMLWRQAAGALEAIKASAAATPTASATQAGTATASSGQDLKLTLRPKPQPIQPKGCPPCQECPDLELLLKSYCTGTAAQTQTATAKASGAAPSFKAWELGVGIGRLVTSSTDQLQPYARGSYFRPWTPSFDAGVDLQVFGPWDLNRIGDEDRHPVPLGFAAGAALRF